MEASFFLICPRGCAFGKKAAVFLVASAHFCAANSKEKGNRQHPDCRTNQKRKRTLSSEPASHLATERYCERHQGRTLPTDGRIQKHNRISVCHRPNRSRTPL